MATRADGSGPAGVAGERRGFDSAGRPVWLVAVSPSVRCAQSEGSAGQIPSSFPTRRNRAPKNSDGFIARVSLSTALRLRWNGTTTREGDDLRIKMRIAGGVFFRTVIAGVLVAVAGSGIAGASASPTIHIKKREIEWGERVLITGKVDPDMTRVFLIERLYPYSQSRTVRAIRPRVNGYFKVRVRPIYNAKYRIRTERPDAQSRAVQVWVSNRYRERVHYLRNNRVLYTQIFRWSPRLKTHPSWRKTLVSTYFAKTTDKRFRRVGIAKIRQIRRGVARYRVRFRIPAGRYSYHLASCYRYNRPGVDDGLGPPGKKLRCPRGFSKKSRAPYNPFR